MSKPYIPEKINAGSSRDMVTLSLLGSGLRIIRIRSNEEVPDYFTNLRVDSSEEKPRYMSASGVFRYDDNFYGIAARPQDPDYLNSFRYSKIDHPGQRFAEKDMIEFYPLQLQPNDNVNRWILHTNALRHIPIQYNQSTILPLPLHLAKGLEEYLFM